MQVQMSAVNWDGTESSWWWQATGEKRQDWEVPGVPGVHPRALGDDNRAMPIAGGIGRHDMDMPGERRGKRHRIGFLAALAGPVTSNRRRPLEGCLSFLRGLLRWKRPVVVVGE